MTTMMAKKTMTKMPTPMKTKTMNAFPLTVAVDEQMLSMAANVPSLDFEHH